MGNSRLTKAQRQSIQSVIDDPRRHAGMELAATKPITHAGDLWLVPSQSATRCNTCPVQLHRQHDAETEVQARLDGGEGEGVY